MDNKDVCCLEFNPEGWDGKEEVWDKRRFIKSRVRAFLHIPLNFGTVCARMDRAIRSAGVLDQASLWLSDENSLWGSDLYIGVMGDVPGQENVELSGTHIYKVYEGQYNKMPTWISEFKSWLKEQNKRANKIYAWYTTCPKCAKKYGKNYVLLVAQL